MTPAPAPAPRAAPSCADLQLAVLVAEDAGGSRLAPAPLRAAHDGEGAASRGSRLPPRDGRHAAVPDTTAVGGWRVMVTLPVASAETWAEAFAVPSTAASPRCRRRTAPACAPGRARWPPRTRRPSRRRWPSGRCCRGGRSRRRWRWPRPWRSPRRRPHRSGPSSRPRRSRTAGGRRAVKVASTALPSKATDWPPDTP